MNWNMSDECGDCDKVKLIGLYRFINFSCYWNVVYFYRRLNYGNAYELICNNIINLAIHLFTSIVDDVTYRYWFFYLFS